MREMLKFPCAPECDNKEAASRATRAGHHKGVSRKACPEGEWKGKGTAGCQEDVSCAGYPATGMSIHRQLEGDKPLRQFGEPRGCRIPTKPAHCVRDPQYEPECVKKMTAQLDETSCRMRKEKAAVRSKMK